MKKTELAKILKPLVKQCIKEVLFEEGVLSNIVSEVVTGLNAGAQPLVEHKQQRQIIEADEKAADEETKRRKQKINETRKQMLDAIGQSSYNGVDLFEGTQPMRSAPAPDSAPAQGPMANIEPGDAGVDISALMNKTPVWNALLGGGKK
tara:strand:+ start:619 stop:1065 length:447 start_codon:yes stop_codon:yes gene_type:complete